MQTDDPHPTTAERSGAQERSKRFPSASHSFPTETSVSCLSTRPSVQNRTIPHLQQRRGFPQGVHIPRIYQEACKTAQYLTRAGVRGDRVAVASTTTATPSSTTSRPAGRGCCAGQHGGRRPPGRLCITDSGARLAFVRDQYSARITGPRGDLPEMRTWSWASHIVRASKLSRRKSAPAGPLPLRRLLRRTMTPSSSTPRAPRATPRGSCSSSTTSWSTPRRSPKGTAIAADERMLCVLPIHHVNGIVVTLVTPLWSGGRSR